MKRLLLTWAASFLGKHGNTTRHQRDRERIRATARAMRRELGLPPLKVLG